MKYKYSINTVSSNLDDIVLLFNTLTGKSIKLTKECLDIVDLGIENKMSVAELIEALEDAEDKVYFSQLFKLLFEHKILVDEKQVEFFDIDAVIVEITHRCNLSCIHCSACAGTMMDAEVLNTQEMKTILDKIIKINPRIICLTGGEPMVRKDFWELVEYIKDKSTVTLTIMTNGTLINENNVDRIVENFKAFDISLDGINEETCSHIRGKGVFTKVMNTVKLLKDRGVENISLSMVDVSYTHDHIEEFYEMNKSLGTKPIIRAFEEIGRGEDNAEELRAIDYKNIDKGELRKLAERIGSEKRERRDGFSCGAARTEFFVDDKGDLYPCAPLKAKEFLITSVLNNENFVTDMITLNYTNFEGYKNLIGLMPQNVDECSNCPFNMFCWSCLHDIYEKKKNPANFAFRCELKKKELICMW